MKVKIYFFLIVTILGIKNDLSAQMFWNQAAKFNSDDSSYIAVKNSPTLNLTGDFTIECWIYTTNSSNSQIFISKSPLSKYFMGFLDGKLYGGTNGSAKVKGTLFIENNTWTHVAFTFDSSNNRFVLYVNGILDNDSTVANSSPAPEQDSLLIGRGISKYFDGGIDEIRIWNRLLSQNEVATNLRTSLSASGGKYDGLMFSMPFQTDNSNGQIFSSDSLFSLNDFSGNENHGFAITKIGKLDLSNRPSNTIIINNSIYLDGKFDYLSAVNSENNSPTSAITLEAWVYPDTMGTGVIVSKDNCYRLLLSGSNNTLKAKINNFSIDGFISNANIPENIWSHVAFTYNSSDNSYAFYVNGVLTGFGTNSVGSISNTSDSLYIGGGSNLVSFKGYIDEIRISNYIKSQDILKKYLYTSIDDYNEPFKTQINLVYNFDGYATAQADGGSNSRLYFRGDAVFSNPKSINYILSPVSPLNRSDELNFQELFQVKTSNLLIPERGIIYDSIYISEETAINDLNLFIGINHSFLADLKVTLTGPNNDSVIIYNQNYLNDGFLSSNLSTIFDDDADSSLINRSYVTFSPIIKPYDNINNTFSKSLSKGYWKLKIEDLQAIDFGMLYTWGIQINNGRSITNMENTNAKIGHYKLNQNYPNPFNPITIINFYLPNNSRVILNIFDITGKEVATIINNEFKTSGEHNIEFNGSNLASGVYFYKLEANDFIDLKKMILIK